MFPSPFNNARETPQTEVAALAAQLKFIAQTAVDAQATTTTPENVTGLVSELKSIARAAVEAQSHLANIMITGSFVPVPSFVAGTPPTPEELAATAHPEAQHYWVVLRGRQPGLYLTPDAANAQTKGVPDNKAKRATGRPEALAFYAANYPAHVKKWIEVAAPVPQANLAAAVEHEHEE